MAEEDEGGKGFNVICWIVNFNNCSRGFTRLVDWLRAADIHVAVLDNGSTWEPLLRYYETSGLQIIQTQRNLGPYAFWSLGLYESGERFILTDPDVVPSADCPKDIVERMSLMLDKRYSKVGPSLRIDNLPDCYPDKEKVIAWEQQWWLNPVEDGYRASIDTTFAMYAPETLPRTWDNHLRLAPPYSFEHVPWYEGTEANAEREFYNAAKNKEWTNW